MLKCESISQLLLVNHTTLKRHLLVCTRMPGDARRADFRKSKISLSRKFSQKIRKENKLSLERNPTEKNKTTGRQRRVVLFFLLTAVPPAEASRPGTLICSEEPAGQRGALYLCDITQDQTCHWSAPRLGSLCRESWEDRGAILCNLSHLSVRDRQTYSQV